MVKDVASEPTRLESATIKSGPGNPKPLVSLNGLRTTGKTILYFGLHGSTIKLELCDNDANSLFDLLEEMSKIVG